MKKVLPLLLSLFALGMMSNRLFAQTTVSIADAHTMPLNSLVTVKGIVLNGTELGNIRYLYDGTGGIGVFNAGLAAAVNMGDSLQVTGVLSDYNNLLEIVSGTGFTYNVINTNNPLPEPQTVSTTAGFSDDYEGQLVRFENMRFMATGNFSASSTNYDIVDIMGNVFEVRINGTTNIAGDPIPNNYINLIGIMSQYQTTYQLLPRSSDDFQFVGNPPVFSTPIQQLNLATTSFTVNFETINQGNTEVDYGLTAALELGTVSDPTMTTNHNINLTGLQPGTIYYVRARSVGSTGDISEAAVVRMGTVSLSSGTIKTYFNRSVENSVSTGTNAIYLNQLLPDTLRAYINRAKYTIDICLYSFDNENGILAALQAAAAAGKQVRVVGDSGISDDLWSSLPGTKSKRPASLNGIMHNKFLIIDANSPNPNEPIVWTGATNFSNDQLRVDANDVIIFQDQTLARAYTIEFEEMLGGTFSSDKTDNTPKEFLIGGKRVEAYFSPSDQVNPAIQRVADSANDELYFGLLSFTRTDIAYKIEDRAESGVFTAGILDDVTDPNSAVVYDILAPELGTQLVVDNGNYIFHHKYMIVDQGSAASDPIVLTGSHNWTNSAQFRNDENTVIVHDATIANIYYQEFVARYINAGGTGIIVGISPISGSNPGIALYPNPTANALHITLPTNSVQLPINICNAMGQVIYTQNDPIQQLTQTIDVKQWPAGVYFVKIGNNTAKFVIAK